MQGTDTAEDETTETVGLALPTPLMVVWTNVWPPIPPHSFDPFVMANSRRGRAIHKGRLTTWVPAVTIWDRLSNNPRARAAMLIDTAVYLGKTTLDDLRARMESPTPLNYETLLELLGPSVQKEVSTRP